MKIRNWKFKGWIPAFAGMALLACTVLVMGADYRPLPEQTQAAIGATHVARITYSDLTETNANTTQTVTVATIPAYHAIEGVIAVLKTAFTDGTTNFLSTTVQCGDVSVTSMYLAPMEVNANATEEFLKWGTRTQQVYTVETPLIVTVIPTGISGLSSLTAGEILIYLKDIDQPTFAK